MIGFSVRSESGRCSSSSSRLLGRTAICWSRAWTGSSCDPITIEANTSRIPTKTRPANRTGSTLDLDVHDLLDREEADGHHHRSDAQHDDDHRLLRDPEDRGHQGLAWNPFC